MKQTELVKKLEQEGYKIEFGKYEYWDGVPYVVHQDNSVTWLAELYDSMGSSGVNLDLDYRRVKKAIGRKAHDMNDLKNMESEDRIKRLVEEETE